MKILLRWVIGVRAPQLLKAAYQQQDNAINLGRQIRDFTGFNHSELKRCRLAIEICYGQLVFRDIVCRAMKVFVAELLKFHLLGIDRVHLEPKICTFQRSLDLLSCPTANFFVWNVVGSLASSM